MRRLIINCFIAFLFGIVIYNNTNYFLIGAALTALFLIFFIKKYKFYSIFLVIFILMGIGISHIHTIEFDTIYNNLSKAKYYEGYIIEKSDKSYTVKNYEKNYKVILNTYSEINGIPGDYIIFTGKAAERLEYKKKFLNSLGINAYIKNTDKNIIIKKTDNFLILPSIIKYKLNKGLISVNKPGGAFISGLVTGYTDDMTDDVKNDFGELGISHILAVSGYNIGIIFYFMLMLTKNINARKRYLITLTVCFIYTAIGGFEPSLSRAFLMISIVIISKIINRYHDVVSGITLSAFIMLLMNSFYIYNIGFLLSYFATYGIILFNKGIEDKVPEKLIRIKSEISVSLSAFLATIPLILWYKGFFSLISILVNIIVSPIIAVTTIMSFAGSVVYIITSCTYILYPLVFIGNLFIKLIDLINKHNVIIYPGQPSVLFIITYYLFVFIYFGFIKIDAKRLSKGTINITMVIVIILTLFIHKPYLKIHFINVGQGDSTFIETPDRKTILIDTGPSFEDSSALKSKVLPYIKRAGYNRLDLLIITHFHNDHCGDYEYLLDNFKIGKAITFRTPTDSHYKFTEVSRGDTIKIDNFILDVLFPENNLQNYDDKNETCIVLRGRYKNFSILLTADADKTDMDKITGDFDIFRVPHHGSVKSLSYNFLNASKIGTAIISVGKNNFGHPSGLVLDALQKRGIKTYRTDHDGNITLFTQGEYYKILLQ